MDPLSRRNSGNIFCVLMGRDVGRILMQSQEQIPNTLSWLDRTREGTEHDLQLLTNYPWPETPEPQSPETGAGSSGPVSRSLLRQMCDEMKHHCRIWLF